MPHICRLWRELVGSAIVVATALGLAIIPQTPAHAHPGGLNLEGCHNNRKTGDYHCHRGSAQSAQERQPSGLLGAGGAYANCTEARAAGAAPVHRGQPGYGPHLDRDGDELAASPIGASNADAPCCGRDSRRPDFRMHADPCLGRRRPCVVRRRAARALVGHCGAGNRRDVPHQSALPRRWCCRGAGRTSAPNWQADWNQHSRARSGARSRHDLPLRWQRGRYTHSRLVRVAHRGRSILRNGAQWHGPAVGSILAPAPLLTIRPSSSMLSADPEHLEERQGYRCLGGNRDRHSNAKADDRGLIPRPLARGLSGQGYWSNTNWQG